ncbi:MAG: hypothetical protein ABI682_07480 [Acidobacteriota bacterium]
MPEARVIQFPAPAWSVEPARDAKTVAEELLAESLEERSSEAWGAICDADVAVAVADLLRLDLNSNPNRVLSEAEAAYERISTSERRMGVFDEKDYLLGDYALLAGIANRLSGNFESAEGWFDLADASFRQTIDPYPSSMRVAHARLVVRYELRRFSDVVSLITGVISGFESRGMLEDAFKARFLQATSYKELGNFNRSLECLVALQESIPGSQVTLRSFVLTNLAEEYARRADHDRALTTYEAALALTDPEQNAMAYAQLMGSVGESYRLKGEYALAVTCFRAATNKYAALGMATRVASLRVVTAETLLTIGRDREAEWEILAALPTIEDQRMVVEGFGATALLKESVRRRRTDPAALRELSAALRAK